MSKPIYEQRQSPEGGLVALKEKPSDLMKRITERTATKVIDYAGNPEFVKKFKTDSRDFPGATTSRKKGSYGPAMNYSTTPNNMGEGGFTNATPGTGSAISESATTKLITFIESLRNENNARLLDTVMHGFSVICESEVDKQKMNALSGMVNQIWPYIVAWYEHHICDQVVGMFRYAEVANVFNGKLYGVLSKDNRSYAERLSVPENVITRLKLKSIEVNNHTLGGSQYRNGVVYIGHPDALHEYMDTANPVIDEECIKVIKSSERQMKIELFHELVHAWDENTFGDGEYYDAAKTPYHNVPTEINAHLLHRAKLYIDNERSLTDFLQDSEVIKWMENFDDNERRRVLKRLHALFSD